MVIKMTLRRMFVKDGGFTKDAGELYKAIVKKLRPIMSKYAKTHYLRDVISVMRDAVEKFGLELILDATMSVPSHRIKKKELSVVPSKAKKRMYAATAFERLSDEAVLMILQMEKALKPVLRKWAKTHCPRDIIGVMRSAVEFVGCDAVIMTMFLDDE
jgi:hypothetical protein